MSYIHLPDPHPGRCQNFRRDPGDDYGVKTLRCLQREGHDSKCRFPPASKRLPSSGISHPSAVKPEPWTPPENVDGLS